MKVVPAAATASVDIAIEDRAAIAAFLERAWSEHGLADNTLASYRRDLEGLARWGVAHGRALADCSRADLFAYLAERGEGGYSARSNARLLSALRHFFRSRQRFGATGEDPTLLLDSPKLPRPLPKALSEGEVEALLRAPDVATPLGLRDRAMFELIYAPGLRVSELVGLRIAQVNLRQGVLRVTGKGSKDRLVPIGEEAEHWLQRYYVVVRSLLVCVRVFAAVFFCPC